MTGTVSFQTDESWPAGLLTIFNHARAKRPAFEYRYYGPYDKLLNYCFGDTFSFYVAPQKTPRDDSRGGIDFTSVLVVFDHNDKPVMFLEVKDDHWAQKAELRFRADGLMRDREWNIDILSQAGFAKMKEIVNDILDHVEDN
ncbi:hypothetical protein FRB90_011614 [Tulasnella sp. 427]|nr:hypothetical protein FRB90_011614 [Tulasnella sp. 427]